MNRFHLSLVAVLVAGCSGALSHSSSPTASPEPTPAAQSIVEPSSTKAVLTGEIRLALTVPGELEVRLVSAQTRADPASGLAGYRFVAFGFEIRALRDGLAINEKTFQVRDGTRRLYEAVEGGATPAIHLPLTLSKDKSAKGFLTFEIPWGGLYKVVVAAEDGSVIAEIESSEIADARRPTPALTQRPSPTSRPRITSTGSGGTSGSGWTQAAYETAVAWQSSASATYLGTLRSTLWSLAYMDSCGPGRTPAECAAGRAEGAVELAPAKTLLALHLSWMNKHPAARCFQDAYAADRAVASAYGAWIAGWWPSGDYTPGGRAQLLDLENIDVKADTFFSITAAYFSDCR